LFGRLTAANLILKNPYQKGSKKMAKSYTITETEVRSLANAQSFDRGYSYYRNGSVHNLIRRGNQITARVEGSDYEPYRVEVLLDENGITEFSCTCPYDWGGICKHIVATLLVVVFEAETLVEKPPITDMLENLTAEQLRQVLIGLAELGPEFVEAIEREVSWIQDEPAKAESNTSATVAVDINAVRREISKDFRLAGKGDPFQHGYYDEYAGLEMYPDEMLQPHLEKVLALLDADDVDTAVTLITAIIESYIDGLADLDEWVYEYNMEVFAEANVTLGAVLAECLLSRDMEPDQQAKWLEQIDDWEDSLGDFELAKTAVEQGWSYPPLVAAMQGNITKKGAWETEAPFYADELALARLHILERHGRTTEYINLAEAEGQAELAINMIARSGDIDKTVAEAKAYLVYPQAFLTLAYTLAAEGQMKTALELAEYGLDLDEQFGKAELARWTREQASQMGNHALALKAAQEAFNNSFALADYKLAQELAGDQWHDIKPKLHKKLNQSWNSSQKIDVYLHENMLDEAMQVFSEQSYFHEHDLRRVIEATRKTHPNWGIRKSKHQAEYIMDAGKAGNYDTAVTWLRLARDIYQQHQRQAEWETYLEHLLDTHHRKYKLVPMLRNIRV